MMNQRMRARRWSDNDHYFGPFTYANDSSYRPLAVVLSSRDDEDDENAGSSLRLSAFGQTLIIDLPGIVRPWRRRVFANWDAPTVERMGRDWYWDTHKRQFGFSVSEGFLQVFLGPQTHDSETTKSWSKFLPWTQWRFNRFSLYGLNGEHLWTQQNQRDHDSRRAAEEKCPTLTFAFADFDGEQLFATTHIEEHEWLFGEGWFKWLSLFRRPKVRRSLDIKFSGETGQRKGSWKGGTIGHSIDMLEGELHDEAFARYCAEHSMKFSGRAA